MSIKSRLERLESQRQNSDIQLILCVSPEGADWRDQNGQRWTDSQLSRYSFGGQDICVKIVYEGRQPVHDMNPT